MADKILAFIFGAMFGLILGANIAHGANRLPLQEPIVAMLLQEAANEPFVALVTIAGVALDRAEDPRWPNDVTRVIFQPWQFTGMRKPYKRPYSEFSEKQIQRARWAVQLAVQGLRPCGGRVLWYHATYINRPARWPSMWESCRYGKHIFYGDIPEYAVKMIW
jgi:spore germination cell wall hydrolase CwlJ-like protein